MCHERLVMGDSDEGTQELLWYATTYIFILMNYIFINVIIYLKKNIYIYLKKKFFYNLELVFSFNVAMEERTI